MKKVTLKIVMMKVAGQDVPLDYQKQIIDLMLVPLDAEKGANYEEMEIITPINKKLRTAVEYILLEDAEHEEVIKRLKNARFRQNSEEIHEMIKSVIDAPAHLVDLKDQAK